MRIRNVIHKGLKRFIERNDTSGLPAAEIEKIRNVASFVQDMEDVEELHAVASWNVHRLTGDRKGTWSVHITRNWRITFSVIEAEGEIADLNFEDYH